MRYNMPLEYCVVRTVKSPEYGTDEAGCLDFFVPQFDEDFMDALEKKNPDMSKDDMYSVKKMHQIVILPGQDVCIPSGIHAKLSPGTALTAFNKSGVATKLRLIRGAEYVDSDYQGEIHLHVINVGKKPISIEQGKKLVQFAYVPVFRANLKQRASLDELYDGKSERGDNWQGSTGDK